MLTNAKLLEIMHRCPPEAKEVFMDYMKMRERYTELDLIVGPDIADDLAEAEEEELELRQQEKLILNDISKIKLQLKRRHSPSDREWRSKAESALKIKGSQHQAVMMQIRTLNSEIKELRRRLHTDYATQAAKEIMTEEQWQSFTQLLREKHEKA